MNRLSPEDPKLTAYALGELQGPERDAVEAAIRDDPEARAAVEAMRAFAAQLSGALAQESAEAPAAASTAAADTPAQAGGKRPATASVSSKVLRFPQLYFVIGGLAAACVAVIVALQEPKPFLQKHYQEVALPTVKLAMPGSDEEPAGAQSQEQVAAAEREAEKAAVATAREAELRAKQQVATAATRPLLQQVQAPAPTLGASDGEVTLSPFSIRVVGQDRAAKRERIAGAPEPTRQIATGGLMAGNVGGFGAGDRPQSVSTGPAPDRSAEAYAYHQDNAFTRAADAPFSTFSVDVDTASYANVRRLIESGQLPPADAVRIEELVNYFPYRYANPVAAAKPDAKAPPFAASLEVADAPWAAGHRLVRIGLKARDVSAAERPHANLVFLLDVSGSMDEPNKLPLVKESMRLLLQRLEPEDRVAIVIYAGASGLALPSTPVSKAQEIVAALDNLTPGGSTNGAMGIQLAYDIAKANFVPHGINRVILCTDGDFNVGVTSEGELVRLVEEKARSGIALTVLGFGMGNYKDSTLEQLADKGNGNYGYIDTRNEAEKLLAQQVNGTLLTVAKDVKIQVEFNPARVASYRLIGYEDRLLQAQDFNDDKVAAGYVGSGHTVTALYEIVPTSAAAEHAAPAVDPLKYASATASPAKASPELLTVKLRYKDPERDTSERLEFPLIDAGGTFANASSDFKFAAAVAEFGMILRQSPQRGTATLGDVLAWGAAGAAHPEDDPEGYRRAFLDLVRRAEPLLRGT
jgi:Ca-activated chloride channel family protein